MVPVMKVNVRVLNVKVKVNPVQVLLGNVGVKMKPVEIVMNEEVLGRMNSKVGNMADLTEHEEKQQRNQRRRRRSELKSKWGCDEEEALRKQRATRKPVPAWAEHEELWGALADQEGRQPETIFLPVELGRPLDRDFEGMFQRGGRAAARRRVLSEELNLTLG
jgi:hypothetical protein